MKLLKLGELLKERKITGKQFAEDLGFSQNTASNLINGKSFPSGKDLKAIADYLDVDIRKLFNPTKEMDTEPIYIEKDGSFLKIGEIKIKY